MFKQTPMKLVYSSENKCPDHLSPLELYAFPGGRSEISCNNGVLQSLILNCTGLLFGNKPTGWPGDRSFYLTAHHQNLTSMQTEITILLLPKNCKNTGGKSHLGDTHLMTYTGK